MKVCSQLRYNEQTYNPEILCKISIVQIADAIVLDSCLYAVCQETINYCIIFLKVTMFYTFFLLCPLFFTHPP